MKLQVICVETGELLRSFQEHTGTVISIALTSNDEFLVTGNNIISLKLRHK